ncbi:MAG: MBL fold metallo-hydrolase, partial [Armatimonadota bacterium]|nr:MBL fold metallo-hydrolase [Armatimonadota bacterium]
ANGTRVVIDPPAPQTGYTLPAAPVDIALVTHEHADHNNVAGLKGSPEVLHGLQLESGAKRTIRGVAVQVLLTEHDPNQGTQRGKNAVFILKVDGVTIVHCGDLGRPLSTGEAQALGSVDVLLVPVGGNYTIDGPGAAAVVKQVKPRVVVPMHYKTAVSTSRIAGPEGFLDAAKAAGWETHTAAQLEVKRGALPAKTRVVVLHYQK